MLDTIYNYMDLLKNIDNHISESRYKKEYVIAHLGISRATYYNKVRNNSFTPLEMISLVKLLFPEEAKSFEIRQSLKQSREDSKQGKTLTHSEVMNDVRNKLCS